MKEDEILATLASGYQTLQDRQVCLESMIKGSILIPSDKVNNILIAIVLCVAMFCIMFGFIFTAGY